MRFCFNCIHGGYGTVNSWPSNLITLPITPTSMPTTSPLVISYQYSATQVIWSFPMKEKAKNKNLKSFLTDSGLSVI